MFDRYGSAGFRSFMLTASYLKKKRFRDKQLSQPDREKNQSLERTRGICERIIGRLKVFKILAERYRKSKETIWG